MKTYMSFLAIKRKSNHSQIKNPQQQLCYRFRELERFLSLFFLYKHPIRPQCHRQGNFYWTKYVRKGDWFIPKHLVICYAAAYSFPHLTANFSDNKGNHFHCTSVLAPRPKPLLDIWTAGTQAWGCLHVAIYCIASWESWFVPLLFTYYLHVIRLVPAKLVVHIWLSVIILKKCFFSPPPEKGWSFH